MLPVGPQWFAVIIAGVIGGLAGGIFSRLIAMIAAGFKHRGGRWVKTRPVLFAALCGLILALCGLGSSGNTFGTGYEQAQASSPVMPM